MGNWAFLRNEARRLHGEVCADARRSEGLPAAELLTYAESFAKVEFHALNPADDWLAGAKAMLDGSLIFFDVSLRGWEKVFSLAHELAHHWLKHGTASCFAVDVDPEAGEGQLQGGAAARAEGYGPHARRECAANVFAREFLLPSHVLRRYFCDEGLNAAEIAQRLEVPIEIVYHQLTHALLTPTTIPASAPGPRAAAVLRLNRSQRKAATVACGPLLLEAGPGTGKTRTLVGRILHLLESKVDPESILVLTFSTRAAEEIRERVSDAAGAKSDLLWTGTFHSFGLELLRRFGDRLGLPPKPQVIDFMETMRVLEFLLPRFELKHFQNLKEPVYPLIAVYQAISRAKDAVVGPESFREAAKEMLAAAPPTYRKARIAAEKAVEAAGIYEVYQEHLQQKGLLDFGDLVARAVELLRENKDVRDVVRREYQHVLVDEYQDVNRASGLLLKEVAGDGAGLWAVGDTRQSIHRWRGAAPQNVREFADDFPRARLASLDSNYRSRGHLVAAFSAYAVGMEVSRGRELAPWRPKRRGARQCIEFEVASDVETELRSIAAQIKRRRSGGTRYHQQAVLARTHAQLATIAQVLEREGVPVLYFDTLFEREEVRDLLSLVELVCEGRGRALTRVARFEAYTIPPEDVSTLVREARDRDEFFPDAFALAPLLPLADASRESIARLASDLDGATFNVPAWRLLADYLFTKGTYLRELLDDVSVAGVQRRLAVHQLLQFAHDQLGRPTERGVDPKREFLRYVRHLAVFGDEQLRQLPPWADHIDAVRLLTVHASKGLEFSAVHLPLLSADNYPKRRFAPSCPTPPGLCGPDGDEWHAEEEECLLFVGITRARDVLSLSYAKGLDGAAVVSPLLDRISAHLPRALHSSITWSGPEIRDTLSTPQKHIVDPAHVYPHGDLRTYMVCPRQYLYRHVLGLATSRETNAYVGFHVAVRRTVNWICSERAEGRAVSLTRANEYFVPVWDEVGPAGHAHELVYLRHARAMIRTAVARTPVSGDGRIDRSFEFQLTNGRVSFTPDFIEVVDERGDSRTILRRFHLARWRPNDQDDPVYALYARAAKEISPGAAAVAIHYLSTDEQQPVDLSAREVTTRLKAYDRAIAGISGAEFDARPNDRECPRCPYYFICPANGF
jgi:DNA helicase-2/ATP-dependent DNA helicase PcrA